MSYFIFQGGGRGRKPTGEISIFKYLGKFKKGKFVEKKILPRFGSIIITMAATVASTFITTPCLFLPGQF